MTDCIKREETQKEIVEWASIEKNLIEEIKNRRDFWLSKASKYDEIKDEMNTDICDGKAVELEVVMKMIQEQPKIGEWIPCSERMPDRSGYYLATLKVSSISFVSIKYFNNFCFRWEDIGNGKITAWQPLPEPWKGEADGK